MYTEQTPTAMNTFQQILCILYIDKLEAQVMFHLTEIKFHLILFPGSGILIALQTVDDNQTDNDFESVLRLSDLKWN